jgi:hypothetical protein
MFFCGVYMAIKTLNFKGLGSTFNTDEIEHYSIN